MTRRSVISGVVVTLIMAPALPTFAQAAPVVPNDAVLTAGEFPSGSVDYKSYLLISPHVGVVPKSRSACDVATFELERRVAGARAFGASSQHRTATYYVSILSTPASEAFVRRDRACGGTEAVAVPVPIELNRVNPIVFRPSPQQITATADVRGATVTVAGTAPKGEAVDVDTFWQVLQAQIVKVDRQP